MRYNWNPWHGCHKKSAGCQNCFVFDMDKQYDKDSTNVHLVKTKFNMPVKCNRQKEYVIPSESIISTCLTSDFFIKEADSWRDNAWQIIKKRRDCFFYIITKRPERIQECLPGSWEEEYKHVLINVTAENQAMADERIPLFLQLPLSYRGIVIAPILEAVDINKYLASGKINEVSVGGESYRSARVTNYEDVLFVREQCKKYRVNFHFHQTGSKFLKDGKIYKIPHRLEYEQAKKAGLNIKFNS